MACCNNECLETVYAACVETVSTYQNIPNDNNDLESILQEIDELLGDNEVDINNLQVTVDAKCLNANCTENITATMNWLDNIMGGDMITLSIDYPNDYIISVKVYSGANLVTSVNTIQNGIAVPASFNNNSPILIVLDLIIAGGTYQANFNVPQNSGSMSSTTIFNCQANTTLTTSITNLFQMLINKICL